ncbi:MAG: acyltransferase [Beijerinckiaceae bacterium]|nr:acyltransferase [Beijerinckiaceae bacterium]
MTRLTSLRAFAALSVFCFHVGKDNLWSGGAASKAYVGVAFFFVLSGFVLVWAAPAADTALRFYRRRFARIYPAHFVMLALVLIVPGIAYTPTALAFLASLTLTQAWFAPEWNIVYSGNGVAWTLSCEAFFYAAFPAAYIVLRRLQGSRRWIAVAATFASAGVAETVGAFLGFNGLTNVDPLIRFPEFLLGMAAALAVREGWRPRWTLLQASIATVVAFGALTALDAPVPTPNAVLPPIFAALIAAAATADIRESRSWLTAGTVEYLGRISFCFYLVHEAVIFGVIAHTNVRGPAAALLALAVATAGAAALHHAIEAPAQRRLRGRSTKPPAGAEAVHAA